MGSEILFKILRLSLIGLVVVLLSLQLAQNNAIEARLRDLREASSSTDRKIGELAEEMKRRPAAGVTPGATQEDRSNPRHSAWWKRPDNILIDPSGEPGPPADAPRGGIIRYYTTSNPRSLNMLVYNEAELQERICSPVYEYLADRSRVDPDKFVPGIANCITVNKDFTEFTCHIREGMNWHAPYLTDAEKAGPLAWLAAMPRQTVTAQDVKFTFDVVRDPQSECGPLASYLADLESVELVDDYTLKIRWKRSIYYNLGSTLSLIYIYPKFIYERDEKGNVMPTDRIAGTFPQHWFNNRLCGTGPFQFAGFVPNQVIKLRRNDEWWGNNKPAIDGIDISIQENYDILLAMFKRGEIDVFAPMPAQYRSEVLDHGDVEKMIAAGEVEQILWEMFTYYYVGWNMRQPVLKDREVRRAMAHLFPKERVIRDLYFGMAVPHDGPVHHWESSYVKDLEPFEYSPEKAAAILEAAGWKLNAQGIREKVVEGQKRELRIKVLHPTQGGLARDIVQLFQKSAQQAGVLLEPESREWSVMTKQLEDKEFEACVLGWGNTWDGDPTQIWHSESALSAKGSNHVSYINPALDKVIDDLKLEFDPSRRKQLWEKYQRIIVADQPYCFTLIRTRAWWVHKRLGNPYFSRLRPQDWFLPWFVK